MPAKNEITLERYEGEIFYSDSEEELDQRQIVVVSPHSPALSENDHPPPPSQDHMVHVPQSFIQSLTNDRDMYRICFLAELRETQQLRHRLNLFSGLFRHIHELYNYAIMMQVPTVPGLRRQERGAGPVAAGQQQEARQPAPEEAADPSTH